MLKLRRTLSILAAISLAFCIFPGFTLQEVRAASASFSGHGSTSTSFFHMDEGLVIATFSHTNGNSNFIVHLVHSSGSPTVFLVNEIGATSGQVTDRINPAGSYIMTVQADGDWSVSLAQPRPSSAAGAPQSLSGHGQSVSPFIQLGAGVITVRLTHNGSSNFIVHLVDLNGRVEEFITNEIGPFSGARSFGLPQSGIYLFDINADGNWTLIVEQASGTPGPTPTHTASATPTPRPQPSCTPRPRVQVTTTTSGPNQITATVSATGVNNYLSQMRFGPATNAQITANGQSGTGNFSVNMSGFPTSATFTVQRRTAGQPMQVPLVVADGCGDWSTFVGAGTGVQ